ncbi:MAG: cytochrome P460 family protein [Spirochaetes bacterium]|nr:cytochrome P460 family protein [Spirochaetota bacterium]
MRREPFVAVAAVLSLIGCGGHDVTEEVAKSLRDYKGWRRVSTAVATDPLPGHGAGARIIYGNDTAFRPRMMKGRGSMERMVMRDGAVLVKESYAGGDRIGVAVPMITIMVKMPGHPLAQEGWLYFVKRPGRDPVLITGRLCIGCHESANEGRDGRGMRLFRDYLFLSLPK